MAELFLRVAGWGLDLTEAEPTLASSSGTVW